MKKIVILILSAMALSNCAISSSEITPANFQNAKINSDFEKKIELGEVSVAMKEQNSLVTAISPGDFKKALYDSLQLSGYCTSAINGRYILDAELTKTHRPFMGDRPWELWRAAVTVKVDISYKLRDAKTGKVVLDKKIRTYYTADITDRVIGVERNHYATSKAIQKNIEEFITALSTEKIIVK